MRPPPKLQPWFDARQRFRLSHIHIQMARELGLNPRKFGALANVQQDSWKRPLAEFIAHCYSKRFGRATPEPANFPIRGPEGPIATLRAFPQRQGAVARSRHQAVRLTASCATLLNRVAR